MNDVINISIRDILVDASDKKQWRVIYTDITKVVLCQMDIDRLNLVTVGPDDLINRIRSNCIVKEEETPIILNLERFSDKIQLKYHRHEDIMNQIASIYGPTFEGLMDRKSKPLLKKIMDKYELSRPTLWKLIRLYLQSGMQEYALIDARYYGNQGKKRAYTKMQGVTSITGDHKGKLLTGDDFKYFDEAIKRRTKGRGLSRGMTWKDCYEHMLYKHYMVTKQVSDNSVSKTLKDDIPSIKQFYYYIENNASKEAVDIADTSTFEQLNNKRLLTGSAKSGLVGPGDVFEIDACEVDAALVSVKDPSVAVGRPILYVMVDVYTSMIMAISVAFDNNSVVGLTNVIANLAQGKQELAASYGISFDNPDIWPTGYKPNTIRVDHGSDFISTDIHRIAAELNIDIDTTPVMNGSMKGTVEHIFRMIHEKTGIPLIMKGKIEKRFDSNHHEQAVLNIEDFTKIVIGYVINHNTKYYPSKLKSADQIEAGIRPIPVELWKYYCSKGQSPRLLPSKEQFLYNLMIPAKGTISAKIPGVELQGLFFTCDIPEINDKRYALQRKTAKIDVRYDPRDTSQIYYLDKANKLHVLPLNGIIPENNSYRSMTWKRYLELKAEGKLMDAELERYQLEHSIAIKELTTDTVKEATRRRPRGKAVKTDELRSQRKKEKELVSTQHSFREKFDIKPNQNEPVEAVTPNVTEEKKPQTDKCIPYRPTTMEERKEQVAREAMEYMYDY